MRRLTSYAGALIVLCACAAGPATERVPAAPSADLAHRHLVVDTHIDVPYRLYTSYVDVSQATASGDFDYPRAAAGGLDALFMSIYIPATVDAQGGARALADELIDIVEQLARSHPEKFQIATCAADVEVIRDRGRIAFPMGMENGGPIQGDLANLDYFRDRGIRYITLAHSRSNHIADSSYDPEERWGGLSPFGRKLVPAMNERGVMIDVSHISEAAFWQVLELTATPVVATHSSLRHFTPGFMRNMSDEMVAAMKGNGGVVQINFGSGFLTAAARTYAEAAQQAVAEFRAGTQLAADDPAIKTFAERYRAEHPYPYADIDDVLDHIDRAVQLAGIDHVGLGSDFDGVGDSLPTGLKDVSGYPNLAAGLQRRGYGENDIAKILGGNIMRVWREVESFAASNGYPPQCRQSG